MYKSDYAQEERLRMEIKPVELTDNHNYKTQVTWRPQKTSGSWDSKGISTCLLCYWWLRAREEKGGSGVRILQKVSRFLLTTFMEREDYQNFNGEKFPLQILEIHIVSLILFWGSCIKDYSKIWNFILKLSLTSYTYRFCYFLLVYV